MMATAFFGYVLPWGQMSFWAAAVITNIFAAIPIVGDPILQLLRGGFAVDNPTLNRFFSLHYLLPFIIAAVVVLHIWALHVPGNNNPVGVDVKSSRDTVPFHPYYTMKDLFGDRGVLHPLRVARVLCAGHPGARRQLHHGQPAGDAAAHRAGMVLPAVLRDPARHRLQLLFIDSKLLGVIFFGGSILILFFVPWLDHSQGPLGHVPAGVQVVLLAVRRQLPAADVVRRAGAGAADHRAVHGRRSSKLSVVYYFAYFLVILPLLGRFEKPRPLPNSISEAVLKPLRPPRDAQDRTK